VSVTRRYCIKTAKPILKLFRPSGSPIILVYSDPCTVPNSKGNPFSGRFPTEIAVYLGNGALYEIGPCTVAEVIIKTEVAYEAYADIQNGPNKTAPLKFAADLWRECCQILTDCKKNIHLWKEK